MGGLGYGIRNRIRTNEYSSALSLAGWFFFLVILFLKYQILILLNFILFGMGGWGLHVQNSFQIIPFYF